MDSLIGWCIVIFCLHSSGVSCQNIGDKELLYEWVKVEYDWPNPGDEQEAIRNGSYVIENNIMTGLKYYAGEVYVTVPRWRNGIPSSMNKVVKKHGKDLLQPYPSWNDNKLGDCDALQFTQSMEIDPNNGYMWIIDVGRTNIFSEEVDNKCPPKLVIWDINNNIEIRRHIFPDNVASYTSNFLNDIVIDPASGFAYITDASGNGGLVVYDYTKDSSHRLEHPSMMIEPGGNVVIINGKNSTHNTPIDGIALSADRTQIFYCPLAGFNLHQLATDVAKQPGANLDGKVRTVGKRASQSDGLAFARDNLYYGLFSMNAVYGWEISKDMADQGVTIDSVNMTTQTQLAKDDERLQWQDTFGFDDQGYLWVIANKLQEYSRGEMDFTGANGPNFRIWKIFINEPSYLG